MQLQSIIKIAGDHPPFLSDSSAGRGSTPFILSWVGSTEVFAPFLDFFFVVCQPPPGLWWLRSLPPGPPEVETSLGFRGRDSKGVSLLSIAGAGFRGLEESWRPLVFGLWPTPFVLSTSGPFVRRFNVGDVIRISLAGWTGTEFGECTGLQWGAGCSGSVISSSIPNKYALVVLG